MQITICDIIRSKKYRIRGVCQTGVKCGIDVVSLFTLGTFVVSRRDNAVFDNGFFLTCGHIDNGILVVVVILVGFYQGLVHAPDIPDVVIFIIIVSISAFFTTG
jgi:hypothetical protein